MNSEVFKEASIFKKVYREFTRRKFTKYKQQFPKLRESELLEKVLKQWGVLTFEEKKQLQKSYIEAEGQNFLKDSKSKSKSKSKSNEDPQQKTKIIRKKKRSPKVRVFVEKNQSMLQEENSDFRNEGYNERVNHEESSSEILKLNVKKKIKANNQYLSFFKYYHNRLSYEHPRWSSSQISTIIKLLWRKKRLAKNQGKTLKVMSGRMKYKNQKKEAGLPEEVIKKNWKQLPHESKKYWEIKGKGRRLKLRMGYHRRQKKLLTSKERQPVKTVNKEILDWMSITKL